MVEIFFGNNMGNKAGTCIALLYGKRRKIPDHDTVFCRQSIFRTDYLDDMQRCRFVRMLTVNGVLVPV